ncbi:MAG: glycosyltransferase family 2 protein, partial [Terriglobales bacterium]
VLNQTHQNLEVLVIDDGSTDGTEEVVLDYAGRDARVKLLQQQHLGLSAARNLGVEQAGGEFIALIDADDIWLPRTIEKLLRALSFCGNDYGVSYAWSFDIDEDDRATGAAHAYTLNGYVYPILLCHNFLANASCVLIRSACLKEAGPFKRVLFNERLVQGCEDWELFMRLALRHKFKAVPEFLVGYRKRVGSMSKSCDKMAASQELMLSAIKEVAPVPDFAARLSRSSFYIHLAHQCADDGQPLASLRWLRRSLEAEWITPLLRIEFYTLCLRILMQLTAASAGQTVRQGHSGDRKPDRFRMARRQAAVYCLHVVLNLVFPRRSTGSQGAKAHLSSVNSAVEATTI